MCSPSDFSISDIFLECANKPEGICNNLVPGDVVIIHAIVRNNLGQNCSCASVSFKVNGVVIGVKEHCIPYKSGYENGVFHVYFWEAFGEVDVVGTYTIPSNGTYNFCVEVVSVR